MMSKKTVSVAVSFAFTANEKAGIEQFVSGTQSARFALLGVIRSALPRLQHFSNAHVALHDEIVAADGMDLGGESVVRHACVILQAVLYHGFEAPADEALALMPVRALRAIATSAHAKMGTGRKPRSGTKAPTKPTKTLKGEPDARTPAGEGIGNQLADVAETDPQRAIGAVVLAVRTLAPLHLAALASALKRAGFTLATKDRTATRAYRSNRRPGPVVQAPPGSIAADIVAATAPPTV